MALDLLVEEKGQWLMKAHNFANYIYLSETSKQQYEYMRYRSQQRISHTDMTGTAIRMSTVKKCPLM
jgi:hypothetical protein